MTSLGGEEPALLQELEQGSRSLGPSASKIPEDLGKQRLTVHHTLKGGLEVRNRPLEGRRSDSGEKEVVRSWKVDSLDGDAKLNREAFPAFTAKPRSAAWLRPVTEPLKACGSSSANANMAIPFHSSFHDSKLVSEHV